ncbi:ExbD/TolR family protein [Castellaniella sp. GW247-6E4]|uniref:ExbD/TolR family protein n=1 Tax=Castellaniella sp. GW247-6E4 TaxID=3140380 RepID=UPI003315F397
MGTLRGRNVRRLKNDINVVPYIDVMLVLLVIFMVTAPMITPGQIELPSVGTASEVPVKPVEVQIDEHGEISMRLRDSGTSFRMVDKRNLLAEVQAVATAETPVVISADGKVPYESVMQVMDQLRTGGITRLGLLVNQTATEQKR